MGKKIRVKLVGRWANIAYIELPGHPEKPTPCVKKTISLREVIDNYQGPVVYLDFNNENILIGIEILVYGNAGRKNSSHGNKQKINV